MRCNAEFYYVGKIPPVDIGLQRLVVLQWFYGLFTASRQNNFVGGTCALPSAFLVYSCLFIFISFFIDIYLLVIYFNGKIPVKMCNVVQL